MIIDINKIRNAAQGICRNRLFYISRILNYPLLPPEVLQITLTNRCNLKCQMCFVKYYVTEPEEEMTNSQILNLINDAFNMGIKVAVFSGGEPFLREDIYDICNHCFKKGLWTVITTNGTLLENKFKQIIDSRVSHLHFSVDGLEETHDYIRNKKGCFKQVMNAIKEITNFKFKNGQGPSTSLACVVMKQNVSQLPELFKIADELKIDAVDFLPLLPDNTDFTKFQNENVINLRLDYNEDIKKLKRAFIEIGNIKTRHTKLNPSFDASLFEKYYSRQLRLSDWKCFAGFKTLFITLSDPDRTGRKKPCIFMCKGHVTDILGKDLHRLWSSKKACQLRKEIMRCKTLCFQSCFHIPKLFPFIKSKFKR